MSKVGLLTEAEAKYFGKIISGELPVGGMWKSVVSWFLPNMINNLDDKFGDKIPEPWQTHIEVITTKVYISMQDNVITDEEYQDIVNYCSVVIADKIDVPDMDEKDEIEAFLLLIKWGVSLIRNAVKKINRKG